MPKRPLLTQAHVEAVGPARMAQPPMEVSRPGPVPKSRLLLGFCTLPVGRKTRAVMEFEK
jgi:hypothetical protein